MPCRLSLAQKLRRCTTLSSSAGRQRSPSSFRSRPWRTTPTLTWSRLSSMPQPHDVLWPFMLCPLDFNLHFTVGRAGKPVVMLTMQRHSVRIPCMTAYRLWCNLEQKSVECGPEWVCRLCHYAGASIFHRQVAVPRAQMCPPHSLQGRRCRSFHAAALFGSTPTGGTCQSLRQHDQHAEAGCSIPSHCTYLP